MVSRRSVLLGAASAGVIGLAGCTRSQRDQSTPSDSQSSGGSTGPQSPRATSWAPASQSLPVRIHGTKAANVVEVEGSGITADQSVLGVAPADIDILTTIQTDSPVQYTGLEGDFEAADVRESVTSTLSGSFQEQEPYNGYTRLSSNSAVVGIRSGRLGFVQPPDGQAFEDMLDAREGATSTLPEVSDRVKRLSDAIGDGDIVDIVALDPSGETANDSEREPQDQVGEAYSIDVQPDMSPFVFCYLYREADVTAPDDLRNRIDSSFNATDSDPTFDVTTDGALVTATGQIPTASLPTN